MVNAPKSNYENIERGIQTLVSTNLGWATSLGDYSKLIEFTPLLVITHGELHAPLALRFPQFEKLEWNIYLRLIFDYTSESEAHELYRAYRMDLIQLFMNHRFLDDGNTPYPNGGRGQCLNTKLIAGTYPQYPAIDGKPYVMGIYTLWVQEQLNNIVYN